MTRSLPVEQSVIVAAEAERFATRYAVHELLGKGGMAQVHRATDRVLGTQVALKQLTVNPLAPERAHMAALFEREFHTLAQLSHPHVIGVFDYGTTGEGAPYYAMELLDGGDLRERSPVPWPEACRLMFDVCSAIALLHSRRLLHRDITPRNIRCTQAGTAKLIDFGAMAPMSVGGSDVVGTPGFIAPETLQRLALDARTDLYSFGVTLYYALTGRVPYKARTFADLVSAWAHKATPVSAFVPDVPAALDDLILSLISVEPALRPASAFDVMQRLAACAGLPSEESEAVSRAYLSTPTLVGRDAALATLHEALRDSRLRRSSGVIIQAAAGGGRSRLLDACALDALTRGFSVSRATATGTREPFATAERLVRHILDTHPRAAEHAGVPELFSQLVASDGTARTTLRNLGELEAGRAQDLVRRFILRVSRLHPLLIAVDDVHKVDEPSAALLAELIDRAQQGGVLVVLTADADASDSPALQALVPRCNALVLAPLTREQTDELLGSLFGDVANLELLGDEIHNVARGNPRQTLELAEHLVSRGVIRYVGGSWSLPSKLGADDLPRSAGAAMQARIQRFSEVARFLGEAHALAFRDEFSDEQYRALLPEVSSGDVELALLELLEAGAVLRDGATYRIANRAWSAALLAGLNEEETRRRHRALAELYTGEDRSGYVHHAFAGGLHERGLALLLQLAMAPRDEADLMRRAADDAGRTMWTFPIAIEAAIKLGHSRRELHALRRLQYVGSITSTLPADRESARIWLEQLTHDAGLDLYRSDTQSATPQDRLMSSLQRAHERYLATPEHERVYPVDAAIRHLGEYVLIAVVDGARSLDTALLQSLPDIVEPYVALSPVLESIWLNMRGAREAHCNSNYEGASELFRQTLAKVASLPEEQQSSLGAMRNAVVFALGSVEAQLGLTSAATQAERLDVDPFQRISALTLRKIVRLERGDAEGAEHFRRAAELLSLQQRMRQMFQSGLTLDVFVYSRCNHLAGLTQTIEQVRPLAARYAPWMGVLLHGEGSFQLVRGDYEAARAKFQAGIDLGKNGTQLYLWTSMTLHAGLAECLLALGRPEEACAVAERMLRECEAHGTGLSAFELIQVLALAEAKLGKPSAAARLDALIARQTALGSSGLRVGLSYEARARVAIWSGDTAGFEHFSELTAREYRHGARTPLAARYERLMNEAARAGMQAKLTLAEFQALAAVTETSIAGEELLTIVSRTMAGHRGASERSQVALQMICAAHGAAAGHLYLLTPAGPVLRASQAAAAPAAELAELVGSYVAQQQRRAEDLDEMETGVVVDPSELEIRSHQPLPLRCVVEGSSVLVGVVVLERMERTVRSDQHAELLQVLAASLLESGESGGA